MAENIILRVNGTLSFIYLRDKYIFLINNHLLGACIDEAKIAYKDQKNWQVAKLINETTFLFNYFWNSELNSAEI